MKRQVNHPCGAVLLGLSLLLARCLVSFSTPDLFRTLPHMRVRLFSKRDPSPEADGKP